MSVYTETRHVAGVEVAYRSRVTSWSGWPQDVRDVLLAWNRERRLSFRNEPFVCRLATGFSAFTLKCADCGRFFNSSGSTACRFDGRWYCDDSMIALARCALHAQRAERDDGQTWFVSEGRLT